MTISDDHYYAELKAIAQVLGAAGREAETRLTQALRDESPDWLLERLDSALRAIAAATTDIARFIQEDRAERSATLSRDGQDEA